MNGSTEDYCVYCVLKVRFDMYFNHFDASSILPAFEDLILYYK
jgi:hypothetical protein